jgi:hypothetical protein
MTTSTLWRALAASILAITVAACSDGSSQSAAPAAAPPTPVAGTAAVGAPLANATVSLLCNAGGTPFTASTNAAGKYSGNLPVGCAAPYIYKATGTDPSASPTASITLYGFADAPANINITPLTDIAARYVTANDPAAAYAAVAAGSKKVADYWNATAAANAKANMLTVLGNLGLSASAAGLSDLFQQAFLANGTDPLDKLLDNLKIARGGLSLAALAESMAQNGGTVENKPWNALFPAGVNTISMEGSDCTVNSYSWTSGSSLPQVTGTTAAITLTRSASGVSINVVPNAAATTVTMGLIQTGAATAAGEYSGFSLSSRYSTTTFVNPQFYSYQAGTQTSAYFDTNTATNQQGLYASKSSYPAFSNSVGCNVVSKPFVRSALPSFQPQARLASFIAGSPTQVVSSALNNPAGCYDYSSSSSSSSRTYTYAVSALGDIKFNNTSLPSNWLDSGAFPSAYYSEYVNFDQNGLSDSGIEIRENNFRGMYLDRSIQPSPRFNQYCGEYD